MMNKLGPEIYPGEVIDRIRLASTIALKQSVAMGLDLRSISLFTRFTQFLPISNGCGELVEDIKRATRDTKRASSAVVSLLSRHGYREKSDNKHIKLEAADGYDGLCPITISKTPSDYKSMPNLRKEIERAMGLQSLSSKRPK